MGCVHSRLLRASQRKHFAPDASLLAALVRLDGKELLAESSLLVPQGALLGHWTAQVAPINLTCKGKGAAPWKSSVFLRVLPVALVCNRLCTGFVEMLKDSS